jgi:hypothetical protein
MTSTTNTPDGYLEVFERICPRTGKSTIELRRRGISPSTAPMLIAPPPYNEKYMSALSKMSNQPRAVA